MEWFVGMALAIGVFVCGFGLGVLFRFHRHPPAPKESGLGSAVLLFKSTTDRVLTETAAQREFASGIVTELMATNQAFANKMLAITDNAMERMRLEGGEKPRPRVDPANTLADVILGERTPEFSIPDRSGPVG